MHFFDFQLLIWIAPALLLGLWAQMRVRSHFRRGPAGARAAQRRRGRSPILDSAGLKSVAIEPIEGMLTDHYDPRDKVLRLSPQVYQERSMAAVGVAAHEAGHALQDAHAIFATGDPQRWPCRSPTSAAAFGMLILFAGIALGLDCRWSGPASSLFPAWWRSSS